MVAFSVSTVTAYAADEIVIGASVPLSGPLAGFGAYAQWGYKRAVDEINRAGGIMADGKKKQVKLVIRDDKTDPNVTASNTETLITRDGAVAMLGSSTPPLVNAGALVAERRKIPIITAAAPLESFKAAHKWTYAWDIFFHEPDLAAAPFLAMAELGVTTNKKIAILHENGPDGQVVGEKVWPQLAKDAGYEVVQNSSFPIDNVQFTSVLGEAKAKGVDIVLVMAITPQAVAIRKQMASAGLTPKVLVIEKGGEPIQFAEALGRLADGVLVGGYWDPSFPYPGAADLAKAYETETKQTSSQHIADSYAAAQVLLEAIAAAGTTNAEKVNQAIGKTDKTYVVGPVKFDDAHTSRLPMVEMQWQNGKSVIVWPKAQATGKWVQPSP
jgi:branched-chain amino acid transport system substrate-binding protein